MVYVICAQQTKELGGLPTVVSLPHPGIHLSGLTYPGIHLSGLTKEGFWEQVQLFLGKKYLQNWTIKEPPKGQYRGFLVDMLQALLTS